MNGSAGVKILMRCDSSVALGAGHVMRCLALGEMLREKGADVEFVCRRMANDASALIEKMKFTIHSCGRTRPDVFDWCSDADQVEAVLRSTGTPVGWVIVDHYDLDHRWENRIRPFAKAIMAIDDLADRPHDCDMLLDQNFSRNLTSRYKGLVQDSCKLCLGPEFALLRHEFRRARGHLRKRDGVMGNILISFGGSDQTNETAKVLTALTGLTSASITVVLTRMSPHQESVRRICRSMSNCRICLDPDNMAALMDQADLGIGGCGMTTWERCCMGLPAVVIATAPNQEAAAEALAESGRILYLGRPREVTSDGIRRVVEALIEVPSFVRFLSEGARQIVDGNGCDRVAALLLAEGHPAGIATACP